VYDTFEKDVDGSARISNRASWNMNAADKQPHLDRAQKGVGILTAEDAIALAWTGPVLRASGVKWDIRKAIALCGLRPVTNLKFRWHTGDTYDPLPGCAWKRMRQSRLICLQAIAEYPQGRSWRKWARCLKPPPGDGLSRDRAPKGSWDIT